ncbi:pggt1b [Trichonephila clavipes]|nr:pggt1b [Trichonephila clavipes]
MVRTGQLMKQSSMSEAIRNAADAAIPRTSIPLESCANHGGTLPANKPKGTKGRGASLYVDDLQISCEGSDMRMIERQVANCRQQLIAKCKSTVAPVVFQRVFAYHRSQYSRYSAIYTDGSKRADYVGCGVVIEDIMHGYRLDTSCSIFTAEAVAIYRALQLIDSLCPVNTASILTA